MPPPPTLDDRPQPPHAEPEPGPEPEPSTTQRVASPELPPHDEQNALVVIHGALLGRKYTIAERELTIGRAYTNTICVDQEHVSPIHATLTASAGGVTIRDGESTSGTYVNDTAVHEARLQHGDVIKIGRTIFKLLTSAVNIDDAYHEEVYRLTTVDELTHVFNHRYATDTLEREIQRARRFERPLSLLMLDVDHFTRCNDTIGHHPADRVLRELAELVRDRSRKVDVVARYEDDRLCVILPETALEAAATFAQILRDAIERHRFAAEGQPTTLTVSIGVAELEPHVTNGGALLGLANARLRQAKEQGRNRVVSADEAPAAPT